MRGEAAGTAQADPRRPWHDLGFSFTARQALMLLGFLVAAVAFSFTLDWVIAKFIHLDEERIRDWIHGFGLLAPLVFTAVYTSTIVFTPVPTLPVDIAAGLAFGVVRGTLFVMAGAMVGATIDFYIARWLGRGVVARKLGPRVMAEIDRYAERMGARLVFLARLFPIFNYKWLSYAAGLTRISYRDYAAATLLGTLLPAIAIVYVGDVRPEHPGRAALVFSALIAWSAVPPVVFLGWAGARALARRLRGAATRGDTVSSRRA